jgi:hypothetical protein
MMSVKQYQVLAFSSSTESVSTQPSYLGKTSDLVMKPEPDKTIDLDDGTTETGSEKLTVSFSMLGKIQNPWPVRMIWLVPVCKDYSAGAQIIKLKLDSGDYRIDNKSGEFEKILFNATLRYPTDISPWPYEYDGEYFGNYFMIIGKVANPDESYEIAARDSQGNYEVNYDTADSIVIGCYALVFLPKETEYDIYSNDSFVVQLDSNETVGVHRLNI